MNRSATITNAPHLVVPRAGESVAGKVPSGPGAHGGLLARRRVVPLLTGALVGVVMTAALSVFIQDGSPGRSGCLALNVVSSSNKAGVMEQMARVYEAKTPVVAGKCVDVRIASQASGATGDALARGWDDATDGPRPDVWSPASRAWLDILQQRLAERAVSPVVIDPPALLAQSPQVIAMPMPMAQHLGWPERAIGWHDVFQLAADPAGWGRFDRPEWGRFRLGKTDITRSTSALNATIGSYLAATGTSGELTAEHLADPQVAEFVRTIESSVEHYGETSLTFIENLRRADQRGETLSYLSAIVLEEKSVLDYNRGSFDPVGSAGSAQGRPRVPLVAIYPKEGTLMADHPYAVLNLPWVDDSKQRAAASFQRFLLAPAQQRRFQAAGFRDHRGNPGSELAPVNGLLSGPLIERPLPEPQILVALQRAWRGLRKPARVLVVLDVSGSMANPLGDSGPTKLDLVSQALPASLSQLEGDDEVGLWLFSPAPPDPRPFTEIVALAPYGAGAGDLQQKLAGIQTQRGGSRLFATVEAALAHLDDGIAGQRNTGVVVITDGPNEDGLTSEVEPVLRELERARAAGIRLYPVAYGERADVATLRRMAEASRTKVYEAPDPRRVADVLAAALSNFADR